MIDLAESFAHTWKALDGTDHVPVLIKLSTVYSTPSRSYHNLDHIQYVLSRLEEFKEEDGHRGARIVERDWEIKKLALWFHDFSQNRQAPEQHSAWYLERLCASQLNGYDLGIADRYIRATNHKRVPRDYETAVVLDCDLAILGSPDDEFNEYEKKVRQEYIHVPDHLFCAGRQEILMKFRAKPWIFSTLRGRERWEQRARENLDRSIERLSKGILP